MKFTLSWLKEYIDTELTGPQLADRLTMLGLEVDSLVELGQGLDSVKVCRVDKVMAHPKAERLTICEVTVGSGQKRVVCGAPNVRAGMFAPLALAGVALPSGLIVKETVIRGELSQGMLLSEKELGISEEHSGIMELPADLAPGSPFAEALGLDDTMIEVDLTPNRPDCASVIGIAREVAGFTGKKLSLPVIEPLPLLDGTGQEFSVRVEAPADCPRYAARLVRNVRVGPSPWWLKMRLLAVGMRPINNIVDITNLVMMEFGQPLHAFDFQKLAGSAIVVRRAATGELFTTLDGANRALDEQMLLICDAQKPVAIAGVMGGLNSEVSDETSDVLLESACFNHLSIRRTARRLNMTTEASYRFERGVDIQGVPKAMDRAVRLMEEIAGGQIMPGGADLLASLPARPAIPLRIGRVCDLLGLEISSERISTVLRAIEMQVESSDQDTLMVQPPSFRVDIEREIDLIEEVARLIGVNEIPSTLPQVPMTFVETGESRRLRQRLAAIMTSLGYTESINYSFDNPRHFEQLGLAADDPLRTAVRLRNPLAEDQSIMRTVLLPGLLENVRHNTNRQINDLRLFETGKVFRAQPPMAGAVRQPIETTRLAAVLSGRRLPGSPLLYFGADPVDLYDVRGTVEVIFQELGISGLACEPLLPEDPRRPAHGAAGTMLLVKVQDQGLGFCGEVAPGVLKNFGIKQEVFFLDLDLDKIVKLETCARKFKPLPRFPAVKWDIAMLVPEEVGAGSILEAINGLAEPLVEQAELFDIYRGKGMAAGFKSVAISVCYRSATQTLDDRMVESVHKRIVKMIETKFNARLREANESQ